MRNLHSSATAEQLKEVAIIGGGITGLATAHYLSKAAAPHTRITLLEGGDRLGGWLHSEAVDVGNGQKVLFEKGPRSLRPSIPNGFLTLELIRELGLEDKILSTAKDSVSARNRYVYYPDHLVKMPGPGMNVLEAFTKLFTEPVFEGLLSAPFIDFFSPARPIGYLDESVQSWFARRLGSKIAENLVSAVLHGIYAGDIAKLSMQSLMPRLWRTETRFGSISRGMIQGGLRAQNIVHDLRLRDILLHREIVGRRPRSDRMKAAQAASIYTLKGGLGELAHGLEASLKQNPRIKIERGIQVHDLRLCSDGPARQVVLSTSATDGKGGPPPIERQFSHVVSTISGSKISEIARSEEGYRVLRPFAEIPSVSVMVVNLFFADPSLLPVHGFGYLIPRSIPFEQNPERALGVVFDSDATMEQDEIIGTKVTVMLGGHWWDEWVAYPDEDEGASMAKAVLRRHLSISAEPKAIRVSFQKDCIPQYTVGHSDRLWRGHTQLKRFEGRLRVAGNSYTGVGLNDCVRAAREVVRGLTSDEEDESGLGWALDLPSMRSPPNPP